MERLAAVLPDPPTPEEAAGMLADGTPLSCARAEVAGRPGLLFRGCTVVLCWL